MTKKFLLKDVKKPQLYEEIFKYDRVPKVVFDGKDVKLGLPEDFWITCTTFRDGQQARPPYTVKQIVDLFTMMHQLGGPKGVIRQSEFFLYSSKDKEAVEVFEKAIDTILGIAGTIGGKIKGALGNVDVFGFLKNALKNAIPFLKQFYDLFAKTFSKLLEVVSKIGGEVVSMVTDIFKKISNNKTLTSIFDGICKAALTMKDVFLNDVFTAC